MDWFKHDVYCLQDDRLFTLVSRYGADGYAVFFHTVEAMYANDGNPVCDMTVRRIAFELSLSYDKVQDILSFAASESCGNLFICDDEGYMSLRVTEGIREQEEKRQRYSNMGKASAERRSNTKSNVGSTQVEHKSNVGSTDKIREDKNREDCNSSSPLQEESIKNKSNLKHTGTTPIACSEPSEELKLEAEDPVGKPVFITIVSRTGEEVPVYTEMVEMWKEAYPAVDVEAQLREIKAWSKSNRTNRKSAGGMDKFINNWLSREQDRAEKYEAKSKPVRHKDYSDIKDEDLEEEFHWK